MKAFFLILCLVSFAFAQNPADGGYIPMGDLRYELLDEVLLESGTLSPVYTRPLLTSEWENAIETALKSDAVSENLRKKISVFLTAGDNASQWRASFDGFVAGEIVTTDNPENRYITRLEERNPFAKFRMNASYSHNLSIAIELLFRNKFPIYLYEQNRTNLPEKYKDMDERFYSKGYLTYAPGNFVFQFGRDNLKWGNGYRSSLFLSDNVPYFDFLKLSYKEEDWKISFLFSTLNDFEPQYFDFDLERIEKPRRYMFVQRGEYVPFDWLHVGLSYMAIIFGRDPVLGDINPFILNHNLYKEYQNSLASLDVTFAPISGLQGYFELTSDEIQLSKDSDVDSDHYGAFSYQFGFRWKYIDYIITAEYTFIAPLMYNYITDLGKAVEIEGISYDGTPYRDLLFRPLGHWLQVDSRNYFISVKRQLFQNFDLRFDLELRRNGERNILTPYPNDSYTEPASPTGTVEEVLLFGILPEFSYKSIQFHGAFYYYAIDNFLHTEGRNENGFEIRFTSKWNFVF